MLTVTTPTVSGSRIVKHLGIVSGEAILGANIFRDFFAGIRDIVGGRSAAYEQELRKAKAIAVQEMQQQAAELGANAVVGVDIGFQVRHFLQPVHLFEQVGGKAHHQVFEGDQPCLPLEEFIERKAVIVV